MDQTQPYCKSDRIGLSSMVAVIHFLINYISSRWVASMTSGKCFKLAEKFISFTPDMVNSNGVETILSSSHNVASSKRQL